MATKAQTAAARSGENLPATTQGNQVAAVEGGEDLSLFQDESMGSGYENVTKNDLLIPRLTILQGLSPQVTQGKPEFDKDARVGMIYDVGLQDRFSEGIIVIPVHYAKAYLEWAPRNSGKGLVNIHEDASILEKTKENDRGQPVLDNGNIIAETAQIYVLNMTADGRRSFIPMTSTQLKKAKRLMTLATSERVTRGDGSQFVPPLFYRSYNLTTVPESNNEGNWMGWKIERGQKLSEFENARDLMADIKSFRESLMRGEAKADLSGMGNESGGGAGRRQQEDENAPM